MVVVYDDAFQSKMGYALLMLTIVIVRGGKAGHMTTEVLCQFMTERQHLSSQIIWQMYIGNSPQAHGTSGKL